MEKYRQYTPVYTNIRKQKMKKAKMQNQSGFIHHFGLIVIVVAVIGVLGFAGWRVYSNNKEESFAEASNWSLLTNAKEPYYGGMGYAYINVCKRSVDTKTDLVRGVIRNTVAGTNTSATLRHSGGTASASWSRNGIGWSHIVSLRVPKNASITGSGRYYNPDQKKWIAIPSATSAVNNIRTC
jgi:hypothetical protein